MNGFGSLQKVEGPFSDFRSDIVDATNVPDIDEQEHTLNCSCGCNGNVLIISEPEAEGAYIASTVSEATLDISIDG